MVQPGMSEVHGFGWDVQPAGEQTLKPDRDVAEADGSVTMIEKGSSHDTHRVGEVDDPGVISCEAADLVCDVENDRHGAECLGESPRAGRLLTDTPASEWDGLVGVAGRLPPDPDLQQHG